MPQPPVAALIEDLFVQMRMELVQDLKDAMQSAQKETLEQQRSLFAFQEATLRKMISAGVPMTASDNLSVASAQLPLSPKIAEDPTPQIKEEKLVDGEKSSLKEVVGEAGVSGRGATWIADQDRDHTAFVVENLHYETGICVSIVDSWIFHMMSMFMICANAVYLGIDADWNKANTLNEADWGFQMCEQIFCTFFFVELIIRFGAFKATRCALRDYWFLLDVFMVILMVTETWIFTLVISLTTGDGTGPETGPVGGIGRMLRLLRLARISKVMEFFPELISMVRGMVAGIRAVNSALMILGLIVYVFAIIMNGLLGTEPEVLEYFGTVREAMVTLLVNGVLLDDVSGLVRTMIEVKNVPALLFFAVFILLSALTVMNMLIGTLCEVVIDVSAEEKEVQAKEKMKKTLFVMLQELDADGSGQLSKEEVQSVIKHQDAVAIMNDIQVDTQYLLDISEMIFTTPESTLPITVFMNIVLTLRGKRQPTMNDIAKGHNLSMWAVETQLAHHRRLMTKALSDSQVEAGKSRHAILEAITRSGRAAAEVPSGN
jgi:voltage-gated sodium channel